MNEIIETRIGNLSFQNGIPSKESMTKLYDEMDFQRATQAYSDHLITPEQRLQVAMQFSNPRSANRQPSRAASCRCLVVRAKEKHH